MSNIEALMSNKDLILSFLSHSDLVIRHFYV